MKVFPNKSWENYEATLRASGERRAVDIDSNAFLVGLGLMDKNGALSASGSFYFQALFIRRAKDDADKVIHDALLVSRPVQALLQNQFGVANANKESADAVLRFHELDQGLNARSLGALLTLMARFRLIRYYQGSIEVIDSPAEDKSIPDVMFISRQTPFANDVWFRRALGELDGFIYWLDKNFTVAGLESIWEAADGNQVSEVHILSIAMPTSLGRKAKMKYHNLQLELHGRGIGFEWRFIDSALIRDTHDRWIVGQSVAWNVPDVNTLLSGNHSEIARSTNHDKLKLLFDVYWERATQMDQYITTPIAKVASS
ncbi:MAG: hypothetical protein ABIP74_04580 [Candidatus Saccharimonas sp.]